jgi:hypothetical protein
LGSKYEYFPNSRQKPTVEKKRTANKQPPKNIKTENWPTRRQERAILNTTTSDVNEDLYKGYMPKPASTKLSMR